MNILDVAQKVAIDDSIVDCQLHTYQSFSSSKFEHNDEMRIPIQELDAYTLPSESFLYIEGKLTKADGTVGNTLFFVNNAIAHLFREIRYELNGVVIDSVRNVGLTSTMKGYLSLNPNDSIKLQNGGWFPKSNGRDDLRIKTDQNGYFNVCVPLSHLMGFFEDYKKIIMNMKQELILIRSSDDLDAVIYIEDPANKQTTADTPKIELEKIYWQVPHVTVSLAQQLQLAKLIQKNTEIPLAFRSWDLIEYPSLPQTTRHTWPVKTTTKLESPTHIITGFHTGRKGSVTHDMSKFDHCDLRNFRLFLNSERYPYHDLNLNFKENKFASLYDMYSKFQQSYYEKENQPLFSPHEFKSYAPLVHIDCSRQKDTLQSGAVVVRIEFETNENIPKDTSAYALICHNKLFLYNPLTKIVRQV